MIEEARLRAYLEEQKRLLGQTIDDAEDPQVQNRLRGAVLMAERLEREIPRLSGPTPLASIRKKTKALVRRRDPDTSLEAAMDQSPEKSQKLYRFIMDALTNEGGLTDEELVNMARTYDVPVTPSGLRSRRSELREAWWVQDSGVRRLTEAGKNSIVWEVHPAARPN